MKDIKIEISLLFGFILAIFIGQFTSFANDCDFIRDNTIRLHILANSDSTYDQEVKIKVKDEILKEFGIVFSQSANIKNAKIIAKDKLIKIEEKANDVLKKENYPYKAKGKLVDMYFTTRYYDGFTLPAGYYKAIRIEIGSGKGKNWWCVMYPPMCIPACIDKENLTVDEIMKISKECKFIPKFKIIEIIEQFKK